MFVTYVVAGLTGILTYFSGESFELFVATRFIMGFVLLSISITPFVLGESCGPSQGSYSMIASMPMTPNLPVEWIDRKLKHFCRPSFPSR